MTSKLSYKFLYALIVIFSFSIRASELNLSLEPKLAYDKGILLFQQNKYPEAKPFLSIALEHGYPAAGLMLADTYSTNPFVLTKKESFYTRKAAELDSVIGMLRMGGPGSFQVNNSAWTTKIMPEIKVLAKQGNAFAMRLLSINLTDEQEKFDWFKKAANAGDSFAQYELARRYRMGDGWFLIPGKREREVERLFKASADSGDREGMLAYAKLLKKKNDVQGYTSIMKQLVDMGDAKAIYSLASTNRRENNNKVAAYHYKIFIESMGEGVGEDRVTYNTARDMYKMVTANMLGDEIEQIERDVNEYLQSHVVHYQKRIEEYEYTLESLKQQTADLNAR